MTATLKPESFIFLSFKSPVEVRIGLTTLMTRQFSGFSSSRLPSLPIYMVVEVTISSRIASIGGLVTWAKLCLK